MTWLPSEYLLKGIFLGLLLFAALSAGADPWTAGRVGLWLVGGLMVGLTIAAVRKVREGFRVAGRPLTFLLFLLLESPTLVYAGSILGLAGGALAIRPDDSSRLMFACIGGGAALGLGLMWLRAVPNALHRLVIGLVAAAALVGAAVFAIEQYPDGGARLGPSQPRTDAVVRPDGEGQVSTLLPVHVEPIGVLPPALVAVGAGDDRRDQRTLLQVDTRQRHPLRRLARGRADG